jgi:hypothetical protein
MEEMRRYLSDYEEYVDQIAHRNAENKNYHSRYF